MVEAKPGPSGRGSKEPQPVEHLKHCEADGQRQQDVQEPPSDAGLLFHRARMVTSMLSGEPMAVSTSFGT